MTGWEQEQAPGPKLLGAGPFLALPAYHQQPGHRRRCAGVRVPGSCHLFGCPHHRSSLYGINAYQPEGQASPIPVTWQQNPCVPRGHEPEHPGAHWGGLGRGRSPPRRSSGTGAHQGHSGGSRGQRPWLHTLIPTALPTSLASSAVSWHLLASQPELVLNESQRQSCISLSRHPVQQPPGHIERAEAAGAHPNTELLVAGPGQNPGLRGPAICKTAQRLRPRKGPTHRAGSHRV